MGTKTEKFRDLYEKEKEKITMKKEDLKIVEGIAGVWHYHLSETGGNFKPAICGKVEVMHTDIPLRVWGMKDDHIPSSYCKKCNEIYEKMK